MKSYEGIITKTEFVAELKKHQKADRFVKGTYGKGAGDDFKGCAPPLNGAPGATGLQGVAGVTGSTGPSGINATSVTIVQLCSTCVPAYPSVFAEIAFCVGDKLYATYSANGGFSALLMPGSYSSNGVGCSCTFTVSNDCEVIQ